MIMDISRRGLILGVGLAAAAEIAGAQKHVHDALDSGSPAPLQVFDASTAAEVLN